MVNWKGFYSSRCYILICVYRGVHAMKLSTSGLVHQSGPRWGVTGSLSSVNIGRHSSLSMFRRLYFQMCKWVPPLLFSLTRPYTIRHMRVPIFPMKRTGSLGYLAGSWRETTPHFIIILINLRENETIMFRLCLLY